jgi:hypothetical protein
MKMQATLTVNVEFELVPSGERPDRVSAAVLQRWVRELWVSELRRVIDGAIGVEPGSVRIDVSFTTPHAPDHSR